MKTIGLVLAGGFSTRMGKDKGLLPLSISSDDTTYVARCYKRLKIVADDSYVSIRKEQMDAYSQQVPYNKIIIDSEGSEIHGPLKGILSAYYTLAKNSEDFNLLVSPVDMPHIRLYTLVTLLNRASGTGVFFRTDFGIEPLCGIYSSKLLKGWALECKNHLLKDFSLKRKLERAKVDIIDLPESEKESFRNINSPEDIIV